MTADTPSKQKEDGSRVSNSAIRELRIKRKGSVVIGNKMTAFECWQSSKAEYLKNKKRFEHRLLNL